VYFALMLVFITKYRTVLW